MKKFIFLLFCASFILTSFTKQPVKAKDRTLHLFYVDYSRDKTKATKGFSDEMFNNLQTKLNDIGNISNSEIAFFLSNEKPSFTTDLKVAKSIVKTLEYTSLPASVLDNKELNERIFEQDYNFVKYIDINVYVSEYYLAKDLTGNNAGLFLNSLSKKLQTIVGCDEADIKVNIFYPAETKLLTAEDLKNFFNFQNQLGVSKIKYSINPL